MLNRASDTKTCFSSKLEYSALIRYMNLKEKEGDSELTNVYASSIQSYALDSRVQTG